MFSQPVDPERDLCPTYFQVVTKPMDLGTVRSNLVENKYNTITEWKADVEQVWENAFIFNGKASVVALLAKQLQNYFKEMTDFFTDDESLDWILLLNELRNRMNTALNSSSKMKYIKNKSKSSSKSSTPKIASSKPPKRPPTKSTSSKTNNTPQRKDSNQAYTTAPKQFTEDDIIQLTEDYNSLMDNEDDVGKVTDLIINCEPDLVQGDEVEIEVGKLKYSTLVALRNLVTQLINKKQ